MKKIKITIKGSELMAEIAKWSYTVGEALPDEQAKARHLVQGAADFGHDALIKNAFDMAWVDMLDTLSAYMVIHKCACGDADCECEDCECDKDSGVTEETEITTYDTNDIKNYECTLYFPDDVYPHIDLKIAMSVKTYMLNKARGEWYTLIGRDPTVWENSAEMAKRRLRVTITSRKGIGHTNTEISNFLNF